MTTSSITVERVPSVWFLLVKKFYQEHYPSGKPNKADPIWVLKHQGQLATAVRLKQFSHCQLLTAMVTAPKLRKKGLARQLIASIDKALTETDCYCFAFSHLTPFYQSCGFECISIEQLPLELAQRFSAYTAQGRKLTAMQYRNSPEKQKSAGG